MVCVRVMGSSTSFHADTIQHPRVQHSLHDRASCKTCRACTLARGSFRGFRSPPPISRATNGYCLTHIYVARNMASEHTTAQITPTRVPKDEEAEIAVESRVRQAPKAARAQNETITQLHADTTAETASLYSKAADLHRAERAVSTPPNAQRRPDTGIGCKTSNQLLESNSLRAHADLQHSTDDRQRRQHRLHQGARAIGTPSRLMRHCEDHSEDRRPMERFDSFDVSNANHRVHAPHLDASCLDVPYLYAPSPGPFRASLDANSEQPSACTSVDGCPTYTGTTKTRDNFDVSNANHRVHAPLLDRVHVPYLNAPSPAPPHALHDVNSAPPSTMQHCGDQGGDLRSIECLNDFDMGYPLIPWDVTTQLEYEKQQPNALSPVAYLKKAIADLTDALKATQTASSKTEGAALAPLDTNKATTRARVGDQLTGTPSSFADGDDDDEWIWTQWSTEIHGPSSLRSAPPPLTMHPRPHAPHGANPEPPSAHAFVAGLLESEKQQPIALPPSPETEPPGLLPVPPGPTNMQLPPEITAEMEMEACTSPASPTFCASLASELVPGPTPSLIPEPPVLLSVPYSPYNIQLPPEVIEEVEMEPCTLSTPLMLRTHPTPDSQPRPTSPRQPPLLTTSCPPNQLPPLVPLAVPPNSTPPFSSMGSATHAPRRVALRPRGGGAPTIETPSGLLPVPPEPPTTEPPAEPPPPEPPPMPGSPESPSPPSVVRRLVLPSPSPRSSTALRARSAVTATSPVPMRSLEGSVSHGQEVAIQDGGIGVFVSKLLELQGRLAERQADLAREANMKMLPPPRYAPGTYYWGSGSCGCGHCPGSIELWWQHAEWCKQSLDHATARAARRTADALVETGGGSIRGVLTSPVWPRLLSEERQRQEGGIDAIKSLLYAKYGDLREQAAQSLTRSSQMMATQASPTPPHGQPIPQSGYSYRRLRDLPSSPQPAALPPPPPSFLSPPPPRWASAPPTVQPDPPMGTPRGLPTSSLAPPTATPQQEVMVKVTYRSNTFRITYSSAAELTLGTLVHEVAYRFEDLPGGEAVADAIFCGTAFFTYVDPDGDSVQIVCEDDLAIALRYATISFPPMLRLVVRVMGMGGGGVGGHSGSGGEGDSGAGGSGDSGPGHRGNRPQPQARGLDGPPTATPSGGGKMAGGGVLNAPGAQMAPDLHLLHRAHGSPSGLVLTHGRSRSVGTAGLSGPPQLSGPRPRKG